MWEGLTAAELAACASALVYEARQADDAMPPRLPEGGARQALGEMVRIWGRLDQLEQEHQVAESGAGVGQHEIDLGFAWAAHRWAAGGGLDSVLRGADLPAGDFVRWSRQVIDVLGQIADAAPAGGSVREAARRAVDALRRGVVAYSSVG